MKLTQNETAFLRNSDEIPSLASTVNTRHGSCIPKTVQDIDTGYLLWMVDRIMSSVIVVVVDDLE